MEKTDWNVMILHYLGLDHIGHLEGPYSPLVGPKLMEMDKIIRNIKENIDTRQNDSILFLVCGDHGMSDQGSHGGASRQEVETPFVFMDNRNNGEWHHSMKSFVTCFYHKGIRLARFLLS